jgi:hypothetical protein
MNDMYLEMSKQQGYVPQECVLDGQLVWLLVQEGKSPCVGCNMKCEHRKEAE